jgi:hypothetical protein
MTAVCGQDKNKKAVSSREPTAQNASARKARQTRANKNAVGV